MKKTTLLLLSILFFGNTISAQDIKDDIKDRISTLLLEESDNFEDISHLFWVDYQFLSTVGKRPEKAKTIIPSVGINYEKRLFKNLGLRTYFSVNWWNEDKVLVQSTDAEFKETFTYKYWTGGIGGSWHLNIPRTKWDPYLGLIISVRFTSAECQCLSDKKNNTTLDLFLGTRYLLSDNAYLLLEVGRNGTGFIKTGIGINFN